MGVDRRDYMHDKAGPGAAGLWAVTNTAHRLIVLNVIAFIAWQAAPRFMSEHFLVSYSSIFERARPWTIVTAAFSHQGLWHLVWNMVYLHWFGPELDQIYGRRNFLLLYLHAAVVASLAHVAWAHGWGYDVPMLGASGAVMAVVVVTAIFYPDRKINIYGILPIPLWLLAVVKLLGDLAGMFNAGSGTSHAAHLGGAAAGVFFWWFDLRLFASPGQLEIPWPGVRTWLRHLWPRRAVVRKGPRVDGDTAVHVDELLRKISSQGMSSLTPEELAFLKNASDRYRGS